MKKLISIAVCAAALCGSATQYSCLSIITAAKQAGKWEPLKAWIAAAGLKDEWDKCSYMSDTYPQYAQITNALVAAGIVTDAEIRTILAASRDTAIPDDMIIRVVSNECATAQGRIKWHGKIVTNVIDTNALTRTQTHEDGFVFVERFKTVQAIPVEVRLSAAERKAQQEAAARARAEAEAKRKADRIADLQTNMTAWATAYARQKQYPLDLATMLLQHELNTLVGTNTVNAVITPGK